MAVTLRSNYPSRGPSLSQMGSGEIYAPEENGLPAQYTVSPQVENPDAFAIASSTGGIDWMNQANYAQNANRFSKIQEQYGVPITGMENKLQYDESKAAAFDKMTPADKLAVQMVMSGAMAPKDYYTIAKKAETDRETAAMKLIGSMDLNRNPVDLMQGGKSVPLSAGSLSDLMNPAGQTSAEVGKPYPTMVYNVGMGGQSSTETRAEVEKQKMLVKEANFSEKEKTRIASASAAYNQTNMLTDLFNSEKFGGSRQLPAELLTKYAPIIGKYVTPANFNYQQLKGFIVDDWLRVATGAAAPPKEHAFYESLLPSEGDPPEVADKSMRNFLQKVLERAESEMTPIRMEAAALRKAGREDLAEIKEYQADSVKRLVQDYMGNRKIITGYKKAATPTPTANQPVDDFEAFYNTVGAPKK